MFSGLLTRRRCERVAVGLMALTIGLGMASGALADNIVRTRVTAGTRTASTANLNLGNVAYSHSDQHKLGTMVLTADDSSGTNAGWNVTVIAGDFIYDDTYAGGLDIPAGNLALTAIGAPSYNAGEAIEAGGPLATANTGTLDTARKVIYSAADSGKGNYGQNLDVDLTIPADSLVGAYVSTLTVTIAAGPGA
jgi:hypothetical protein